MKSFKKRFFIITSTLSTLLISFIYKYNISNYNQIAQKKNIALHSYINLPLSFLNDYENIMVFIIILILLILFLVMNNIRLNSVKNNLYKETEFKEIIINTASTLIFILDAEGRIISLNKYAQKETGFKAEEIINKSIYETLIDSKLIKKAKEVFNPHFAKQKVRNRELSILCKNNKQKLISWSISQIVNLNKEIEGILATGIDITKHRQAEAALKYQSLHDSLTGLANREGFSKQFQIEAEIAKHNNEKIAVFFLDIDRFKLINDIYGHQTGDLILLKLSERLQQTLTNREMVARMGGDDFIGILPQIHNHKQDIPEITHRLTKVFDKPFIIKDNKFVLTASIGISFYPDDSIHEETLLRNADTAMYKAKEEAGTSFQLYNDNMNLQVNKKLCLEHSLRRAIKNKELRVYYQPIVDIKTGKIKKAEALVRWEHPKEGLISLGNFIPLAEETGLIVLLGEYVLKEACFQTQAWIDKGYQPIEISVNLSAQQFHKSNLTETVKNILTETRLDPKLLGLEITESLAMENIELTCSILEDFKQMNVKILLDDFGTGYSSLSYLTKFAVDIIKIDRSFISNFHNSSKRSAIVSAIIAMANKLTIKTVAEGVENWEEIKFLNDYKCDEAQGYLFSKPVPAHDFEELLKQNIEFRAQAL
jgi:polar amino acid transport system substrate-binding protein